MATTNLIKALGAADIDTKELTTNLVAAVKEPRQKLIDIDKKKAEVAISNTALLKSGLSALSTAAANIASSSNLNKSLVTSTDTATVSATSDDSAVANSGTYSLVVTQLAEPQRQQAAFPSNWTALSTLAIDLSSVPGAADGAPLIVVEPGHTSTDIVNSINAWIDEYAAGSGVSVSRINTANDLDSAVVGDQSVAIVIEGPTGSSSGFTVDFLRPEDGVVSPDPETLEDWVAVALGDLGGATLFDSSNNPTDAVFYVNGVKVTRQQNTASDVLDGITLELKSVSELKVGASVLDPPDPTNYEPDDYKALVISAKPDATSIIENIKTFVETYNVVSDFLKKATGPKVEGDDVAGSLQNDSSARAVLRSLRTAVTATLTTELADTPGSITHLNALGISFDRVGVLQFKESVFTDVFASDAKDVVTALGNNTDGPYLGTTNIKSGLAGYIANLSYKMTSSTGAVTAITKSYEGLLSRVDKKQITLDDYIERLTEQYDKQFTALNAALASFKATGAQLEKSLNFDNEN